MRTLLHIIRKEFLQIFRNKSNLPLLFLMPVMQLLILSNAADYETRHIRLQVVDSDASPVSRRLTGKLAASPYFELIGVARAEAEVKDIFLQDKADIVVDIPSGFGRNLVQGRSGKMHLSVNAINGSKAGIVNNYATAIIQDFNGEMRAEILKAPVSGIDIRVRDWFNPNLDYKTLMVPGVLVLLVTMIGLFLSGMNIVREKEIGTIEQLNVTPIRKYQFILGKLFPFWVIAMFDLVVGLLLGRLIFGVPMVGNPLLVLGFAAIYLIGIQGIGLLISTFTDTQQQAMFIAWFFMVIFILMSGLFTPIESMPEWAQTITWFNPIAWFVEVIRMVMLKGSGFADIWFHFLVITIMGIVFNIAAVLNYSKRS